MTLYHWFNAANPDGMGFCTFYAANLRAGMFTGFLTLGSFLMAMTTMIVTNMRQGVYHTPTYRKRIATRRSQKGKAGTITIYGPLRRLTYWMLAAIGLSIATSVSQFTIGLIESDAAAYVCVGLAMLTVLSVLGTITLIGANLHSLFADWEEEGNDLLKKENSR